MTMEQTNEHTHHCKQVQWSPWSCHQNMMCSKALNTRIPLQVCGSHREKDERVSHWNNQSPLCPLCSLLPPCPLLLLTQTTSEPESSGRSAELFRTTFTYPPLSCSNTNKLPIYLYYPDVCHLEK